MIEIEREGVARRLGTEIHHGKLAPIRLKTCEIQKPI
jgi:hypothetical protein